MDQHIRVKSPAIACVIEREGHPLLGYDGHVYIFGVGALTVFNELMARMADLRQRTGAR